MRLPAILVASQHQAERRAAARRWSPLLWLWLLVAAAWVVTLLAVFTRHTEWGDHHYLLQTSGLPFFSALGLFLAAWQVMILAMMVQSVGVFPPPPDDSHARCYPPGALAMFLAGYDLVWIGFWLRRIVRRCAHPLAGGKLAMAWRPRHDHRHKSACAGRSVSVHAAQGAFPDDLPE